MSVRTAVAHVLQGLAKRIGERAVPTEYFHLPGPSNAKIPLAKFLGDTEKLQDPYTQVVWVYAAVRAIAMAVAGTPLRLYTGTVKEPRAIEGGSLYNLFARPNSLWSGYQLIEATSSLLDLHGNAMWALRRDSPTADPIEIFVLGHDNFRPVFRMGTWTIDYWTYRIDGSRDIRLETYQVLHFRNFNPTSMVWGLAPLTVARLTADQDYAAEQYNKSFFENSAIPGGIITSPGNISDPEWEKLKARWFGKHKGVKNSFNIAALSGGSKFEPISLSHDDMCFVELAKWDMQKIATCFAVPPNKLGIFEHLDKALDKAVEKGFWTDTVKPRLKLIEDTLYSHLFMPYNNGATWSSFDLSGVEALQEDHEKKAAIAGQYFGIGVPFNEINRVLALGFQDQPWGDDGYIPIGMVPAGTDPDAPADDSTTDEPTKSIDVITRDKLPHTPRQLKEWEEREARRDPIERRFNESARVYLNRVKRWLKAKLDGWNGTITDLPADFLKLAPEFDKDLSAMAGKYYKQLAVSLGPMIERHIREAGKSFDFEIGRKEIVRFLRSKTMKIVENINKKGINEVVRKLVVEAKLQGYSISTLQENVFTSMRDSRARALTIARTETAQAANGVERECEVIAGVKKHMWISARDEVTRESHLACMALGAWPIGKEYPNRCLYPSDVNGPPGEVINCRCSIMAVS